MRYYKPRKKHIASLLILIGTFELFPAPTQAQSAKPVLQTVAPAARITFRKGERPGMLSLSGRLVLDEALIDGRLVTRYWNPNGQIWPEMHFADLKWTADQPAESFRLSVNRQNLSGGYEWQEAELCLDPSSWRPRRDAKGNLLPVVHGVVTLLHRQAGIRVKIHTRLDGSPFLIRWLEIANLNKSAVALTEVAPFAGMLWNHRSDEHLPKDWASPFAVAYNRSFDWGTMARFHNTELSDWMRLPRGIKILNGVSISLPPEIVMRTFGTESGGQVLDGDVDTQLRHCFYRMIFRGIAPSLEDLSPYLKEHVTHYVKIFKEVIRPTMMEGKVFHHTSMLPLAEATPWCVLEYAKADRSTSVAAVFRTSCQKEGAHPDEYIFRPRGIDPALRYRVQADSRGYVYIASGEILMREGIKIPLEQPQTSELVILQHIPIK